MSGPAHNHQLGCEGEDAAAAWYEAQGFDVLERNWRVREGEVDLICAKADVIAFVEVKTRSSDRFGGGAAAVGWKKQQRIRQLAMLWLEDQDTFWPTLRFDVIDVDGRGHLVAHVAAF